MSSPLGWGPGPTPGIPFLGHKRSPVRYAVGAPDTRSPCRAGTGGFSSSPSSFSFTGMSGFGTPRSHAPNRSRIPRTGASAFASRPGSTSLALPGAPPSSEHPRPGFPPPHPAPAPVSFGEGQRELSQWTDVRWTRGEGEGVGCTGHTQRSDSLPRVHQR